MEAKSRLMCCKKDKISTLQEKGKRISKIIRSKYVQPNVSKVKMIEFCHYPQWLNLVSGILPFVRSQRLSDKTWCSSGIYRSFEEQKSFDCQLRCFVVTGEYCLISLGYNELIATRDNYTRFELIATRVNHIRSEPLVSHLHDTYVY